MEAPSAPTISKIQSDFEAISKIQIDFEIQSDFKAPSPSPSAPASSIPTTICTGDFDFTKLEAIPMSVHSLLSSFLVVSLNDAL
ncbi:hypothetical protein ACSBR1_035259 [Camellia fascicularis]